MTIDEFEQSLSGDTPPDLAAPLQALWHAARGDWHRAHQIAQSSAGGDGDWVHAYLHRVEGDLGNAAYWYHRAGRPVESGDLKAEWRKIVKALL